MSKKLAVLFLAIALQGCATRPLSNAESKPIPSAQIIDSRYLNKTSNTGTVTVKRDSGFGGSACSSRVFVNAQPIADINAAEKVVLYLPANEYIISAWPNGVCGGGMSEVRANVTPGGELNFRIGYGSNGDFTINATAF